MLKEILVPYINKIYILLSKNSLCTGLKYLKLTKINRKECLLIKYDNKNKICL